MSENFLIYVLVREIYLLFYYTVDSGYQAHALVGTIAKIYALHNEVRYIGPRYVRVCALHNEVRLITRVYGSFTV